MVTGRLFKKTRPMQHRPALGVRRCKNQSCHPRHGDGTCAHGAGLQTDIEAGAQKPLIAQPGARSPQHQNLGMGGGIAQFQDTVAVAGQKRAIRPQQHRPHRHLAPQGGRFRFFQRQCYGLGVFHV